MSAKRSEEHPASHVCHEGCSHDHGHSHGHHPHGQPSADQLFHAPGESPAVYSATRSVSCPSEVSGQAFSAVMMRCVAGLRDWAVAQRHMVGHIKVFVENGQNENLWLASTGRNIQMKSSGCWDAGLSQEFKIHFTAIIFGPDPCHLKGIAMERLDSELGTLAG